MARFVLVMWFGTTIICAFYLWFQGEVVGLAAAFLASVIICELVFALRSFAPLRKTRYVALSITLLAYGIFPFFPDARELAPSFLFITVLLAYATLLWYGDARVGRMYRA